MGQGTPYKEDLTELCASSAPPPHFRSTTIPGHAARRSAAILGRPHPNPTVLRRLHRHVGVDGRYLSIPKEEYLTMKTWGEANRHWIRTATELGEQAITGALAGAGLKGQNLGAIFFISVTGICSPSIDALLINKMGLCRNIRRLPIFGLGCVAGAAAISRAADYVKAYPDQLPLCSRWNSARSPFSVKISRWPT